MLSRKQTWRRIRSRNVLLDENKFCDGDSWDIESQLSDDDSSHNSSMSTPVKHLPAFGAGMPKKLRSALSLSNLSDLERSLKPKDTRTMRFSSTVHVCLIPTRNELRPSMDEMFWKSDDYNVFKTEAVQELKAVLQSLGLTAKQAITTLYQPSERDRMEDEAKVKGMILEQSSPNISNSRLSSLMHDENTSTDIDTGDGDNALKKQQQQQVDLKFLIGIKTDVEMNRTYDESDSSSSLKMPKHTPAGHSNQSQMWAVQWKANVTQKVTPTHSSFIHAVI